MEYSNIDQAIPREVGFDLAQVLSGHRGYRAYLYRFRHANSSYCPKWSKIAENAEQALFQYPRLAVKRVAIAGEFSTIESIVEHMYN